MRPTGFTPKTLALLLATTMLAACGGSDGGSSGPRTIPAPPIAPGSVTPSPPPPPAVTDPAPPPSENNTLEYRSSTGATSMKAIAAYDRSAFGQGVTVGVIDTGLGLLARGLFEERIHTASTDIAGIRGLEDPTGHGSAVAAIIGAARDGRDIQGGAYRSQLMVLRTDTPDSCVTSCAFSGANIARALDHARVNGAKVVNISLGGSLSSQVIDAVDRATAAGMLVVVAAGNSSAASPNSFAQIAATDVARGQVIIAGALDERGAIADFSDRAGGFGRWFLATAGENVRSYDQYGNQARVSGTSFAAPNVAAAAALVASAFPNLNGREIADLLLDSARDYGASGTDEVYGRGILDLERAFAPKGSVTVLGTVQPMAATLVVDPVLGNSGAIAGALGRVVGLDSLKRAYVMTPEVRRLERRATLLSTMAQPARWAGQGGMSAAVLPGPAFRTSDVGNQPQTGFRLSGARMVTQVGAAQLAVGLGQGGGFALTPADPTRRMAGGIDMSLSLGRLSIGAERGEGYHALNAARRFALAGGEATVGLRYTRQAARGSALLGVRTVHGVALNAGAALPLGAGVTLEPALSMEARRFSLNGGLAASATTSLASAWSVSLAGEGRRLGWRMTLLQPLTVEGGSIAFDLPRDYDYATESARFERTRAGLREARRVMAMADVSAPVGPFALSLRGFAGGEAGVGAMVAVGTGF